MPNQICTEPKCPEPATYRGRCQTHARTNNRDTHSNTAHRAIYNSKRWAILRRQVLTDQPICAGCDNALSVDVHHKVDLANGGAPFERNNLEALCKPCHSRLTRQHQQHDP